MCQCIQANKKYFFKSKKAMSQYYKNEIKSSKELLESFKKEHIEPNIMVGQLYSLTSTCGFNKFNSSNSASNTKVTLQVGSIVMITKIRIVDSIDYFNMGPALIISILYHSSSYHLFIFPNQISKSLSSPSAVKYSIPNNIFVNFDTLFAKI